MKTEYHPTPTREVPLRRAILVYDNTDYVDNGRPASVATVHEVKLGTVLPGAPLTRAAIMELATSLLEGEKRKKKVDTSKFSPILPERLIAYDRGLMAWHCPSAYRPIHFQTNNDKLNKLSGKMVFHPHLLFIVSRGMSVFALAGCGKPGLDTPVCRAPYHNIWETGNLCVGSAKMPNAVHHGLLHEYEQSFFRSAFTHSNVNADRLTAHPGGHLGLWTEMCMNNVMLFPSRYLVPTPQTVKQAILKCQHETPDTDELFTE